MRVAQGLYEDGLITYMRTDGVDMAPEAISAARKAIANRYDAGYVPDKPRQYQSKAKNAQEAHEAIRPTDFAQARAASGDHARLYELVYNRALASQMASARLERTTVELSDGAGRARASRDRAGGALSRVSWPCTRKAGTSRRMTRKARGCRRCAKATCPRKTGVEASQHFTQPPPRYSEASLVKRLEELGIGRPSTYAATLQTLKDREYVRVDKARFIPEESGRLVTAFLERFFERYVNYDYTAELEDELDEVSGGRLDWQKLLDDFWRDFKPKAGEVMDQKPSEITQALDEFLAPVALSAARRWQRSARLPAMRQRPADRCAAASSVRSSPAPTIRNASSRRSSGRAAARRRATGRPIWVTGLCSRAGASAPTSSAARARTRSARRSPRTCRSRM